MFGKVQVSKNASSWRLLRYDEKGRAYVELYNTKCYVKWNDYTRCFDIVTSLKADRKETA